VVQIHPQGPAGDPLLIKSCGLNPPPITGILPLRLLFPGCRYGHGPDDGSDERKVVAAGCAGGFRDVSSPGLGLEDPCAPSRPTHSAQPSRLLNDRPHRPNKNARYEVLVVSSEAEVPLGAERDAFPAWSVLLGAKLGGLVGRVPRPAARHVHCRLGRLRKHTHEPSTAAPPRQNQRNGRQIFVV
jgi:hypothetical protein